MLKKADQQPLLRHSSRRYRSARGTPGKKRALLIIGFFVVVIGIFAALAGGMFVPLLPTGADPRWGELTAETNESMGAFVAEILRDMVDGEIDSVEAGRALKLHTELLRLHARLHAHLRAIHSKKDKT